MAEKKKTEGAGTLAQNKLPLIAGIVVVVVVAIAAMVALSQNGVAESDSNATPPAETAAADGAAPQEGAEPMIKLGNPVVATVNGENVMRSDVFNFISGLPEQVRQMPIQNLFPLALEQVINNKLITTKAAGSGLENDPEVGQLVTQTKEQIVRNVYVDRQIKEQITQKKLLKAYEKLLADMGTIEETKASHILVDTEEKAREVIGKLDGGADFKALVTEYSTGEAAKNGGELGWFAKNEMVPEFAEAAFAVAPGGYSKDPVKTQFGWHVIKVEERRTRPEPEFEAVKPQLEAQLRQEVLNELVQGWQKDAKIKKFDINGEALKDN